MQVYFSFPEQWYVILAILLVIWMSIFFYRKSYKRKKEIRQQIMLVIITLAITSTFEFIGVPSGLWSYSPGNWPVILWFVYFFGGLAGYQIMKLIENY